MSGAKFSQSYDNDDANFFDSSVSEGTSFEGVETYIDTLKTDLLKKVKEKLDDVSGIDAALAKGWQGDSRDRFITDFLKAIDEVIDDLEDEARDLSYKLHELLSAYYMQDNNM